MNLVISPDALRGLADDLDQGVLGYPTHASSPRATACYALRSAADEIERCKHFDGIRSANEDKWAALHELYSIVKRAHPELLTQIFENRIRRVLGGRPADSADGIGQ